MAVLAKAGCNAGTCHGNKNGKGGLKLSLRGQDPEVDYYTLTRDLFALRANAFDPEQSLILLKPTTQIPHEGGVRFKKDSEEYGILRRWAWPPACRTICVRLRHLAGSYTANERHARVVPSKLRLHMQLRFARRLEQEPARLER